MFSFKIKKKNKNTFIFFIQVKRPAFALQKGIPIFFLSKNVDVFEFFVLQYLTSL